MNDDQNLNQNTDNTQSPQEETVLDETNAQSPEAAGIESDSTEVADKGEAETGESSQLSEAGEVSSESTSPDVHEAEQADSEQSEEAELENRDQASEPDTNETPADESDSPARWYVVHTYSGHENRVAQTLKQRIESEHLEDRILEVLVPTQDKIEIRGGKKETIKEKIFPGYIIVKMILDDAAWLAIRTTQGVTSFVGMGNKPTPISEREVRSIVSFMEQGAQPTYKTAYVEGDTVKIVDGPFSEFIGKVDTVDKDRGKVKVLVSIFGRETPVELDFLQVQKL